MVLAGGPARHDAGSMQGPERPLWVRWVGANTLGETIGLGFTALVAVAVAGAGDTGRLSLVAAVAALVAAGAVEGVAVGYAQWRVLRDPLAALRARSWVLATVIGAVVAWTLGMVPSTLAAGTGEGGVPPFSDAVQYLLAALMGLVLGPVLGVPQWRVLRRFVPRAGQWVLANAVAWAAGMPVIFLAAGSVPAGAPLWLLAAAVLGACAAAGAVVGAVHGVWLVWLLRARAGTN
jgi:hypothetical protein